MVPVHCPSVLLPVCCLSVFFAVCCLCFLLDLPSLCTLCEYISAFFFLVHQISSYLCSLCMIHGLSVASITFHAPPLPCFFFVFKRSEIVRLDELSSITHHCRFYSNRCMGHVITESCGFCFICCLQCKLLMVKCSTYCLVAMVPLNLLFPGYDYVTYL